MTFAPKEKRIAYAASIFCPDIPEKDKPLFKQGLTEMAHISMREQAGADMVKAFSGREVPVVVDPTLLLTADEWRKVSRQPAWYHGGDYILTYFLGERPAVVNKLSEENGLPVVNILDKDVYEHYVTSPDEFLWAIEHAKLMYTDSFHGTVFSILFRTPFVVCNRIGSAVEEKMGSRIDTLLGYFGLDSRRGTLVNDYFVENPLAAPDWSNVDRVLERERRRADEYLRQALKL
ncbi:polysaccharide pyruvyl transferase family protein [Selenomonas sp. AE3005]|uniref:polysaccharide pyruvyl transferase family protein n=1 Tax=Selenomonas sp. AE3005 TaxID=1485543 RepID=UPI00068A1C01|nr:polysaccharide pyruvyl transferase family protein [Selenomonas sp. AE3005]